MRPGRLKVRMLRVSVIKSKITSASQLSVKKLIYFKIIARWLFSLYSDYYANKLYKFRLGPQKLGNPSSAFVQPGNISLSGLSKG